LRTTPSSQPAILLIEDDFDIGALIVELLQGEGYRTTIATSAQAGIDLLRGQAVDLVLSDAFAEGDFGADRWRTLDRIRQAAGTTPLVICTAHRADAFSGYAERGFVALLEKPFDLDDLLALMARQLAATRSPAPPTNGQAKG
jgi:CheY-like chemotaxis protein